jgi:hypothetical protein
VDTFRFARAADLYRVLIHKYWNNSVQLSLHYAEGGEKERDLLTPKAIFCAGEDRMKGLNRGILLRG